MIVKPTKHPTQTAEYWERLSRDELAFAREANQTAESKLLHRDNAAEYQRMADKIRRDNA